MTWVWFDVKNFAVVENNHKPLKGLGEGTTFVLDYLWHSFTMHGMLFCLQRGLIYRDVRFANWCCRLKTVISNIEVGTASRFKADPVGFFVSLVIEYRRPFHQKDRSWVFDILLAGVWGALNFSAHGKASAIIMCLPNQQLSAFKLVFFFSWNWIFYLKVQTCVECLIVLK